MLQKYLDANDGSFGWRRRYDAEIASGFGHDEGHRCAYLIGHYMALLEELIRIIGKDKVRALLAAQAALDEQKAALDEQKAAVAEMRDALKAGGE